MNEKFLWRVSCAGAENSSQIASVNTTYSCHILNRNIILEVLFDNLSPLYIIITHLLVRQAAVWQQIAQADPQKDRNVPSDEKEIALNSEKCKSVHPPSFSCLPGVGHIDWRILGKATNVEDFCGTQPVKLQPRRIPNAPEYLPHKW